MNPLDMLDRIYARFGSNAELIMRKCENYVDWTVRVMRPQDGLYHTAMFRVSNGTGKTMVNLQLDHAIRNIEEAIDGNRH